MALAIGPIVAVIVWGVPRDRDGPRCMSIAGPFVFVSAQEPISRIWISVPRFTKDVSGLQQLSFKTPLAFGLHTSGSRYDFELSAVQISELPGKRSTRDSYRDPALGKIIRSATVASFDLSSK